ncbi:MAG: response regulator [Bacteroidia bacterium]|jgi:DNA-binding response OmpR family regulator
MKIDTILIIDDEIDVCILLRNYLMKKNKKADFATNLKDGVEKFIKMKPDLLILDHNIANEYGTENISTFKKLNKSSVVVIISAASAIRQEALKKGADFFIEKPLTYSSLSNTLKK